MGPRKRRSEQLFTLLRFLPLVLLAVLALLILWKRDEITVARILAYTPANRLLAALFLWLLYGVKSLSVFFPIVILQAAGGLLFPAPAALAVNLVGGALCVSLPYWIGRWSGGSFVAERLERYEMVRKLNRLQRRNDLFFSYLTRALGVLPCDVVSLYLGSLKLSYPRYLLGSLLGLLPTLVAMTFVGVSAEDPASPLFLLSAGASLGIALISSLLLWRFKRKHRLS